MPEAHLIENDPLESLEHYLTEGEIAQLGMPVIGGGGHRDKTQLILSGGISCIGKLARDETHRRAIRCERAAWLVARELGWTDLVGAVVLREVEVDDGDVLKAAICVTWHQMGDNAQPAVENLPEDDVWRAAVFDALIEQTDRGGNNWGVAPEDQPCLRLYDHAYSFGHGGLSSSFYEAKRDKALPDWIRADLDRLADSWAALGLDSLLPDGEAARARGRLDRIRTTNVLTVSP